MLDYKIATELGENSPFEGEPEQQETIISSNKDMLPKASAECDRSGQRAQHPKSHGTVRAKFTVLPLSGEDKDCAVGLFGKPETYEAWLRFSNSRFFVDNPDDGDAHGLAIKLFGVGKELGERFESYEEETFDFILMDNETFFDGDLAQYANFNDLAGEVVNYVRNGGQRLKAKINEARLGFWLGVQDRSLKDAVKDTSDQKPMSPVTSWYWSTTPYLLGEGRAVKYEVRPLNVTVPREDAERDDNYLKDRLKEALQTDEQVFGFYVSIQGSLKDHPVEDPTAAWKGARQVKVAELRIPKVEDFDTAWAELWEQGEKAGYNIWNVTPDHRPLGAINRVRREVYTELRRCRIDRDPDVYK